MTRRRTPALPTPQQLIERARAVADRWKAQLRQNTRGKARGSAQQPSPEAALGPRGDLRGQLSELETEIAGIKRERFELRAHNRAAEARAVASIRIGDHYAAKIALSEIRASAEIDAALEADLTVLQALSAACRDFLLAIDASAPNAPPAPPNRPPNERCN